MSEGRLFRSIFDPVDGEFSLLFFLEPDHAKSTLTGSGAGPETVTDKPKKLSFERCVYISRETNLPCPVCLIACAAAGRACRAKQQGDAPRANSLRLGRVSLFVKIFNRRCAVPVLSWSGCECAQDRAVSAGADAGDQRREHIIRHLGGEPHNIILYYSQ